MTLREILSLFHENQLNDFIENLNKHSNLSEQQLLYLNEFLYAIFREYQDQGIIDRIVPLLKKNDQLFVMAYKIIQEIDNQLVLPLLQNIDRDEFECDSKRLELLLKEEGNNVTYEVINYFLSSAACDKKEIYFNEIEKIFLNNSLKNSSNTAKIFLNGLKRDGNNCLRETTTSYYTLFSDPKGYPKTYADVLLFFAAYFPDDHIIENVFSEIKDSPNSFKRSVLGSRYYNAIGNNVGFDKIKWHCDSRLASLKCYAERFFKDKEFILEKVEELISCYGFYVLRYVKKLDPHCDAPLNITYEAAHRNIIKIPSEIFSETMDVLNKFQFFNVTLRTYAERLATLRESAVTRFNLQEGYLVKKRAVLN